MGATDRLLEAVQKMMELNTEVRNLTKRVDKMDSQITEILQRTTRLETFVEIAEKQKKLT